MGISLPPHLSQRNVGAVVVVVDDEKEMVLGFSGVVVVDDEVGDDDEDIVVVPLPPLPLGPTTLKKEAVVFFFFFSGGFKKSLSENAEVVVLDAAKNEEILCFSGTQSMKFSAEIPNLVNGRAVPCGNFEHMLWTAAMIASTFSQFFSQCRGMGCRTEESTLFT